MTTAQGHTQMLPNIPRRLPVSILDRYIYMRQDESDGQIRCVIKFNSKVDEERMVRAAQLTLDAEPILGCKLTEQTCRLHWERLNDQGSIISSSILETKDPEKELWDFMAAPMEPNNALQVQMRIFRSDEDTLCIKIKHIVADAGGAIDYVSLLATIYRSLDVDPAYRPQSSLRIDRGLGQVLKHIGLISLIRACRNLHFPPSGWALPMAGQDLSGKTFSIRRIGERRVIRIRNYCHDRQVSINDVLLAAFYRALFEVMAPKANVQLPIAVTVNLRRHIPSGRAEAISDLSSVFFPAVSRTSKDTFEDTLAKVTKVMKAARVEQPWLGTIFYLQLVSMMPFSLVQRIYRSIRTRHSFNFRVYPQFSNVGVINPQEINFGDINITDITMFGPVLYAPSFLLSVNTFCDTMAFTIGFCHTAIDSRLIEHFMDRLVSELP